MVPLHPEKHANWRPRLGFWFFGLPSLFQSRGKRGSLADRPLKMGLAKRKVVCEPPFFRGYVGFRECTCIFNILVIHMIAYDILYIYIHTFCTVNHWRPKNARHEVLPAFRPRRAVTLWIFRPVEKVATTTTNGGGCLDAGRQQIHEEYPVS